MSSDIAVEWRLMRFTVKGVIPDARLSLGVESSVLE